MNCCLRQVGFVLAAAPREGAKVINVTLLGPDKVLTKSHLTQPTTETPGGQSPRVLFNEVREFAKRLRFYDSRVEVFSKA